MKGASPHRFGSCRVSPVAFGCGIKTSGQCPKASLPGIRVSPGFGCRRDFECRDFECRPSGIRTFGNVPKDRRPWLLEESRACEYRLRTPITRTFKRRWPIRSHFIWSGFGFVEFADQSGSSRNNVTDCRRCDCKPPNRSIVVGAICSHIGRQFWGSPISACCSGIRTVGQCPKGSPTVAAGRISGMRTSPAESD
jgi:hypothetical protein